MGGASKKTDGALCRSGTRGRTVAGLLTLATLGFAGCAQQPQQLAANAHSKEYFPSSVYGQASRRVVETGPVPRGGGQYLVGRPYTVAGQTYYPSERKLVQVGNASWYGDAFHGRLTANGEIYDRDSFTAAHPTMPLPSYARVTNLRTNASMIVRVNDRGPFAANRVMDVSRRVAEALDFQRSGTAKVKVEYVGRASLAGSDDAKLYATLRNDGPAQWHETEPTMVAEARPARVASLEPVSLPVAVPAPVASVPREAPRAAEREDRKPIARAMTAHEGVPREPAQHAMAPLDHGLRWQPGPPAHVLAHASVREPMPVERPGHRPTAGEPAPALRSVAKASVPKTSRPSAMMAPSTMARAPVPPSRSMDLGTIPGAGVAIAAARRNPANLRLARARDD